MKHNAKNIGKLCDVTIAVDAGVVHWAYEMGRKNNVPTRLILSIALTQGLLEMQRAESGIGPPSSLRGLPVVS